MQLQVDVSDSKSSVFLNLLGVLKDDKMVKDFKIISKSKKLNAYECEVLKDLKAIPNAVKDADNKKGEDGGLRIRL